MRDIQAYSVSEPANISPGNHFVRHTGPVEKCTLDANLLSILELCVSRLFGVIASLKSAVYLRRVLTWIQQGTPDLKASLFYETVHLIHFDRNRLCLHSC